jgi:Domain of unknown function (DUF4157)
MTRAMLHKRSPQPAPKKHNPPALRISEPDDAFEREADRIADEVMAGGKLRRHWSISNIGVTAALERKCACGGSSECGECGKKKLQRKTAEVTEPVTVPPIVHEVLNSPGQPLDRQTRAYFEPRFGYDFSKVRVHTDPSAAESARAVNALAYTVEHDIVFAAGQNKPLLAHELTHVVQQGAGERKASAFAARNRSLSHAPAQWSEITSLSRQILQRAPEETRRSYSDTPSGSAAPPAPAAAGAAAPHAPVCGPDVSSQVRAAVTLLKTAWGGWNANQRDEACWSLENVQCGPSAWDIVQLHNRSWIDLDYTPACAGVHANPGCEATVAMDGKCHFAGSVNYVVFGHMCRLCDIWESTMAFLIWLYKRKSANYEGSRNWSLAGYADWPSTGTPPPDRPSCSPTCPIRYGTTAHNSATAFDFHWYPSHSTENVGSECPTALEGHRDLRDNPPEMWGGGIGF